VEASAFPWCVPLNLFLLLSSPRKGKYPGKILVVNERSDRAIRYVKFHVGFWHDNELLPLYVESAIASSPKWVSTVLRFISPLAVAAKP
jgi:hypothetical protein